MFDSNSTRVKGDVFLGLEEALRFCGMLAEFPNVRVWVGDGEWFSLTQAFSTAPSSVCGCRNTCSSPVSLMLGNSWHWSCLGKIHWIQCQVFHTVWSHQEICGVHGPARPCVPRVGVTKRMDSRLTSHVVPVNPTIPAGLSLHSERRASDKPGSKCRFKPMPMCIMNLMHTLPCWASLKGVHLLQILEKDRILPF